MASVIRLWTINGMTKHSESIIKLSQNAQGLVKILANKWLPPLV